MFLSCRRFRLFALALVLFGFTAANHVTGQQRQRANKTPDRPRLILFIAADQFRYDYFERFGDLFAENGFKLLLREGASWAEANYDHFPTYTAPGDATMLTGAYPAATGIVGNDWPDRDTGKEVNSVSDDKAKLLGSDTLKEGSSPRRLLASTLGDELRLLTNNRAKVIGMSLKDRSAILTAGRNASGAYWFSTQSGFFVSSDYYFKQLPAWVSDFNKQRPCDKFFAARWERMFPESEYLKRAGADSPTWEDIGNVAGETNAFPHVITGGARIPGNSFYEEIAFSPFGNDLLLAFAQRAIEAERLGQDEDTDLLTVGFSANDYVGHRYGPYSQEVMDITLRTDRSVAALLDFVDARVGLRNTIVVFTADHGVAPTPKHVVALGLASNRVDQKEILGRIRAAFTVRYNSARKTPDPSADYLYQYYADGKLTDAIMNNNVYFNLDALRRDGVNLEEIERVAGEAALTVPGVVRYFTRSDLMRGSALASAADSSSVDPIARRVQHGFHSRRSGNMIYVTEPFTYSSTAIQATHGSPYSYDTHVPLLIFGNGIKSGRYLQSATPADIAPTLAALLKIQAPSNVTGRILLEAVSKE